MFGFYDSYFANDLAIDLGTANTLIWARAKASYSTNRRSFRYARKAAQR